MTPDTRADSLNAAPPEDFLAFVDRFAADLHGRTRELTGNPVLADQLRDDLLARVAGRWRSFGRRGASPADRVTAAEDYLSAQLSREADESGGGPATRTSAPPSYRLRAETDVAALAAKAWRRSRRVFRIRIGAAVVALAALAVIAIVVRPAATTLVPVVPIPAGVAIMPAATKIPDLPTVNGPVAAFVTLDPNQAANRLSTNPTPRASALFQTTSGDVYVLGADGQSRPWDLGGTEPMSTGIGIVPAMAPTSLAPDGRHAVLRGDGRVTVADLTTGTARTIDTIPAVTSITWWDNGRALLSNGLAAGLLDVATGAIVEQPFDDALPVIDQGAGAGAPTQQLPGPGRVESITSGSAAPATDIGAPSWLGAWVAPSYRYNNTIAAGAAVLNSLALPEDLGTGIRAVAVLRDRHYAGALVATDRAGPDPGAALSLLGWLNDRQLLVATGGSTNPAIVVWTVGTTTFSVLTRLNTPATISLPDAFLSP